MSRPLRRAAIATAAIASMALAMPGFASATNVIPGDSDPGTKIITGQDGGIVTIDEVDRETGEVSGTFVNNTGMNLTCASPKANPNLDRAGVVTTADVATASRAYYTIYPEPDPADFALGSSIPLMGYAGADADFWGMLQLMPTGWAAELFSDSVFQASEIGNAHRNAMSRGMVGEVNKFNLNNGQTHAWTARLDQQAIGARGTDRLGAVFTCRVGANKNVDHFLWIGLEDWDEEEAATGSLGSLTSGSQGSSDGTTGPEGPGDDGDDGDDDGDGDDTP